MARTLEDGLNWLDEQMRQLGIDRNELARRGDFHVSAINHAYAGRRGVGRKLASSIAQGLGVSQRTVFQQFGLLDNEDEDPDEEALQLGKLLMDIEDRNERRKAMGLVTALLRQIALTVNPSPKGSSRPGAGEPDRAKGGEKRGSASHKRGSSN